MTVYNGTITVGDYAGIAYGYAQTGNFFGFPAFGSVSMDPGAPTLDYFAWFADGSAVGIVFLGEVAGSVTLNGQEYAITYDAVNDVSVYDGPGLGGPYPTSGTVNFTYDDGGSGVVTGDLSGTDGADSAAITGAVLIAGSLSGTDGADSASISSVPITTGSLSGVDGADSAAISGTVAWPLISGIIVGTDGADTAAAVGYVRISGALAATDGADTALIARPVFTPALRTIFVASERRSIVIPAEVRRIVVPRVGRSITIPSERRDQ
jgi:hypothetical protein